MTYAVQQTVANELFRKIEDLYLSDHAPAQLEILRLQKSANDLMRVSPVEGSIVRAAIAALQWDQMECLKWSKNAIALNSGDPSTYYNCIVGAEKVNLPSLSVDCARQMYQLAPNDQGLAKTALVVLNGTGHFEEAQKIAHAAELQKMDFADNVRILKPIVEVLAERKISLDQTVREIELAFEVLTESKKRARTFEQNIFVDHDGQRSVFVKIGFWGDKQEQLRLEAALAYKLADLPDWNPDAFSTEFICLDPKEHANDTYADITSSR